MEISPISSNFAGISDGQNARAAVAQAVRTLNASSYFGSGNELTFVRDNDLQETILRVVNRKTQEVVLQLPADYVLRLAEEAKKQARSADKQTVRREGPARGSQSRIEETG